MPFFPRVIETSPHEFVVNAHAIKTWCDREGGQLGAAVGTRLERTDAHDPSIYQGDPGMLDQPWKVTRKRRDGGALHDRPPDENLHRGRSVGSAGRMLAVAFMT